MTHQPMWVILCHLPEKRREEIVEEIKERDREEMTVKKLKKLKQSPLPLPATRTAGLAQL